MKLLTCVNIFTIISAIRVPSSWTEVNRNFKTRQINQRTATNPNLDIKKNQFTQPLVTNDGWIPLIPLSNVQQQNVSPLRTYKPVPTVILPKVIKRPVQKPYHNKQNQYPKKYVSAENVRAIQQPQLIFNPFNEKASQKQTNQKPSSNQYIKKVPLQVFPIDALPASNFVADSKAPLQPSNSEQTVTSINNFFKNFNIDQFLTPRQAIHEPKLVAASRSFENFQIEPVLDNLGSRPLNHKPQYTPLGLNHAAINFQNPLFKNYRDDKTHEPLPIDPNYNTEKIPTFDRQEQEKAPVSSHEVPQNIPTKPVYPGLGKWAKPGIKHKPFTSNHKYETVPETRPDGYETFSEGEKLFDVQRNQFSGQLNNLPKKHSLGQFLKEGDYTAVAKEALTANRQTEANPEQKITEETFVPTRLYAQVRNSENEEHLPPEEGENGRLKELIKDSKVQTVYSEEGYEDSAYDHAGHEKKANNNEGFEGFDRELEKEGKSKQFEKNIQAVPEETYLHKNKFLTDEEIERDKEKSFSFPPDSDIDGSEHIEVSKKSSTKLLGKPPKKVMQGKNIGNKSNGFITSKETKTTTKKNKADGNMETETNGEVRVIMQPNSTSKYHQFVKRYPTVHQIINQEPRENLKKPNATERPPSPVTTREVKPTEIYIEEIFNHTTPATQADEPKYSSKQNGRKENQKIMPASLGIIDKAYSEIGQISRSKRSAEYLPDIEIDTDFIDKISHELGKPKKDTTTAIKYPYYNNYKVMDLNENSPLRYSEDMVNIPAKKEGRMAFYDQAETRITCPEIASTVEPIPDRVLNAEEENDEDYDENYEEDDSTDSHGKIVQKREINSEAENLPRLSGLGDKIDCLKVKYFGENPLDSPIFKEETVGSVKPIFTFTKNPNIRYDKTTLPTLQSINKKGNIYKNNKDFNKNTKSNFPIDNLISSSKISETFNNKKTSSSKNVPTDNLSEGSEVVHTTTMVNLITTPKYTIALKPKNIYDQIQLLNYLPEDEMQPEINNTRENETERNLTAKPENFTVRSVNNNNFKNKVLNNTVKEPTKKYTNARTPKQLNENSTVTGNEILPEAEQLNRPRRILLKPKRPPFQIFDINKFLPTTQKTVPMQLQPPQKPTQVVRSIYLPKPTYQVFDVNKFLPTTTPIPVISASTVLPKYQVISEVFYKDNIKPNEQLNVFTDVLNNIKTSSEEQMENSLPETSKVSETKTSSNPVKVPDSVKRINEKKYPDSYVQAYKDQEVDANYYSSIITSTTLRPIIIVARPHHLKSKTKTQPSIYLIPHMPQNKNIEDKRHRLYAALKEAARKQKLTTTTEFPDTTPEMSSKRTYKNNHKNKPAEVMGLVPPKIRSYKTTYNTKRDNDQSVANAGDPQEKTINKFLVIGMQPPPMQTVYVYSDFINNNLDNRYNRRRIKRSSNRQSYAQVSRGNKKHEATTEKPTTPSDDDDYTPHRSKNYYYDEKLGKIVYLNPKNDKVDEEEVEEEEEEGIVYEIVEQTTEKVVTTPKQNPIFATATPPPEGQSYVDFVKKLKNAANYQEIPDPLPTEQSKQVNKIDTTTLTPVSTTPPEFLSILAQIRNNNEYKFIEDEKEKAKSASTRKPLEVTVVEEQEEEEEESEEIENENIQNSAGKQIHEIGNNFEIFDITGYIPKIKNYLPKTAIDTSKYQTIRRPTKPPIESEEENESSHEKSVNQSDEKVNVDSIDSPTNLKENVQQDQIISTTNKAETTTAETVITSAPRSAIEAAKARIATRVRGRTSNRSRITTSTTNAPTTTPEQTQNKVSSRRRGSRIRLRPTTEKFIFEEPNNTVKVLRRRSDSKTNLYNNNNIRQNGKSETTRYEKVNEKVLELDGSTTKNKDEIKDVIDVPSDVKVFKKYDSNNQHGGNYRLENDPLKENSELIQGSSSAVSKEKINDVEIIGNYDENKKHGGNYRQEDGPVTETADNIEVGEFDAYKEKEDNKDVEVISDYPENKKHGGNYKDEDENFSASDNNSNQNKTNQSENNNKDSISDVSLERPIKVTLWKYDNENKKEWSREDSSKPEAEEAKLKTKDKYRRPNRRPIKKHNQRENQIHRLTDVVPKPEAYYTDPNLPLAVNLLIDSLNVPTEEAEEIATITEDVTERDVVNIAQKRQAGSFRNGHVTSTKKPLFIKDPSKRLYYYAPI